LSSTKPQNGVSALADADITHGADATRRTDRVGRPAHEPTNFNVPPSSINIIETLKATAIIRRSLRGADRIRFRNVFIPI
jgi:hypothetical protein